MDRSPPRSTGSRIDEQGDRLLVRVGPRRTWGVVAFLSFWLLGWSVAGLATAAAAWSGEDRHPVLLVWLCGWVVGECVVSVVLAWVAAGRELVVVAPGRVEVRREIGRFSRARVYELAGVTNAWAEQIVDEEDPRTDYRLVVLTDGETVRAGEGLEPGEAEYLAAIVRDRLGAYAPTAPAPRTEPPSRQRVTPRRMQAVPLLVLVGVMSAIYAVGELVDDEPPRPREAAGYASPEQYAAARTRRFPRLIRARAISQPRCEPGAKWDEWSCLIRVRETRGPYPGIVDYRCSADGVTSMTCSASPRSGG